MEKLPCDMLVVVLKYLLLSEAAALDCSLSSREVRPVLLDALRSVYRVQLNCTELESPARLSQALRWAHCRGFATKELTVKPRGLGRGSGAADFTLNSVTSLVVTGDGGPGDNFGMSRLVQMLPFLHQVDCSGWPMMFSAGLNALILYPRPLTRLNLRDCGYLSSNMLWQVLRTCCDSLQHLECVVEEPLLAEVADCAFPSLRTLRLALDATAVPCTLLALLRSCPSLEKLVISQAVHPTDSFLYDENELPMLIVGDHDLRQMAEACPGLQSFELLDRTMWASGDSDTGGVRAMWATSPRLRRLSLAGVAVTLHDEADACEVELLSEFGLCPEGEAVLTSLLSCLPAPLLSFRAESCVVYCPSAACLAVLQRSFALQDLSLTGHALELDMQALLALLGSCVGLQRLRLHQVRLSPDELWALQRARPGLTMVTD